VAEVRLAPARRQDAQAPVELALILPVALLLIFGVLGAARITTGLLSVGAVAREAARAGALGASPGDAWERGMRTGQLVGAEDHLRAGDLELEIDTSAFGPSGEVRARVRYTVSLVDVPLLNLGRVRLERTHREPVGTYRGLAP
jgi:Flp pilus assembly protein TadG